MLVRHPLRPLDRLDGGPASPPQSTGTPGLVLRHGLVRAHDLAFDVPCERRELRAGDGIVKRLGKRRRVLAARHVVAPVELRREAVETRGSLRAGLGHARPLGHAQLGQLG